MLEMNDTIKMIMFQCLWAHHEIIKFSYLKGWNYQIFTFVFALVIINKELIIKVAADYELIVFNGNGIKWTIIL